MHPVINLATYEKILQNVTLYKDIEVYAHALLR